MPNATTTAVTPERVALYGVASCMLAASVVFRAFRERSNFYAATVWLSRSNGCMLVLLNFVLLMTLVFGRVVQKIFFGQLRAVEIEHLYERSWYSLVDTLLAMAIFRDEFDVSFVLLFGTLLFLKAFHWLSGDRVEFMEQSPSVTRLFHARMIAILWMLLAVDMFLVGFVVELLLFKRSKVGVMILFASEFVTLMISLWSTMAKYLINCQDLRSEEPWEAKSMYIFYVDLCNDVLKLATHLSFFVLLTSRYGLPLSQIRDLYVTGRSCASKVRDLIRYRAATRNMDSRYPDATEADMRAMSDGTCIICREDMVVRDAAAASPLPSNQHHGLNTTPKRLPCGHIFHFHCLRSWLERQQSCPTCRRSVLEQDAAPEPAAGAPQPAAAAPQPGPAPTQPPANPPAAENPARDAPAFDRRMQEFLRRIQSDARRVRQEGNASARRAGRRSGHQTPTQTAPSTSATTTMPSVQPSSSQPSRASGPRSHVANGVSVQPPLAPSSFAAHFGASSPAEPYLPHAQPDGGLWMAPSPQSLQKQWPNPSPQRAWTRSKKAQSQTRPAGEAAAEGEPESRSDSNTTTATQNPEAGGGSPANEGADDDEEMEELDEAARSREHAAKLNSWLDALQKKSQPKSEAVAEAAISSSASELANSPDASTQRDAAAPTSSNRKAPQLIPLFDPSRIPHFDTVHVPMLPYQLLSSTPPTGGATQPSAGSTSHPAAMAMNQLEQLSDQQLARMAQNSRAGLEEYVRVLGQVQSNLSGLVEQLTRILSVDPLAHDSQVGGRVDVGSSGPGVKGKAPAEGPNAA